MGVNWEWTVQGSAPRASSPQAGRDHASLRSPSMVPPTSQLPPSSRSPTESGRFREGTAEWLEPVAHPPVMGGGRPVGRLELVERLMASIRPLVRFPRRTHGRCRHCTGPFPHRWIPAKLQSRAIDADGDLAAFAERRVPASPWSSEPETVRFAAPRIDHGLPLPSRTGSRTISSPPSSRASADVRLRARLPS